MKVLSAQFLVLSLAMKVATLAHAQEVKKDKPPASFPKLEHFVALWERSIFTTKDLPSPDAPAGPNFADSLSLSGIYEIDGGVVAVLVDRTTSQVMEARIGSENEMGVKIRQVTPGASVDKTRIQLQKGDQAGWVSFADLATSAPPEEIQRAGLPTQAPGMAAPAFNQGMQRPLRSLHAAPAPAPAVLPNNPILPPPAAPAPPAAQVNDVPLPPP
ncbi:MAG: hypothetical protein ACKVY0_19640 [Prosthecobacter sp.]|uniref:hypothetical protein n=1 Tax=Prosthecobacter sp. TaxID=1965333 RepID=UPI0038FF876E